jgi:hypothetical protein
MIQKVDRIRFQQYHLLQPAVVLTAVVAVVAAEVEAELVVAAVVEEGPVGERALSSSLP